MLLTNEQKCYLWLSSAEITPRRVQELETMYHGVEGIWKQFGKANGPKFSAAAKEKLAGIHSDAAMDDLVSACEKLNVKLLFANDSQYPKWLSMIDDPPYLLYYAGHLECLRKPCVAIVGTRTPSAYGRDVAGEMSRGLCKADVCVVSGLARGIDEAVHMAALEADGTTVGVLGSGINQPYPSEHTPMLRKIAGGRGLILSEYPLNAEPVPYHFPHRNRIISGLCLGVVLVEGRVKSGGMLTVMSALAQGRNVFAVPGQVGAINAEGPHILLREGARFVTCAQDILEDLDIEHKAKAALKARKLPETQQKIVDALMLEPMRAEDLSRKISMDMNLLLSELSLMEILGLVRREAGNLFSLPLAERCEHAEAERYHIQE